MWEQVSTPVFPCGPSKTSLAPDTKAQVCKGQLNIRKHCVCFQPGLFQECDKLRGMQAAATEDGPDHSCLQRYLATCIFQTEFYIGQSYGSCRVESTLWCGGSNHIALRH